LNEQANQALGRLDGLASILPDPALFIYLYVRKETVFSSQIEGTQSSFSDLMLFESAEAPAVPLKDVQEISNYVAAMNHGLRRLREDFPLSLRLIREIHKILLSKERGSGKHPGEFRETQNWIGGTRPGNAPFVPPPPEKMMECMDLLEKFLHREQEDLPILVKTALVHVQFETIHQSDDVCVDVLYISARQNMKMKKPIESPGKSRQGQRRCVPVPSTRLRFAASANARKSRSRVIRGMPWSIQLWAISASPRRALRRFASTLARNAPARCQ